VALVYTSLPREITLIVAQAAYLMRVVAAQERSHVFVDFAGRSSPRVGSSRNSTFGLPSAPVQFRPCASSRCCGCRSVAAKRIVQSYFIKQVFNLVVGIRHVAEPREVQQILTRGPRRLAFAGFIAYEPD